VRLPVVEVALDWVPNTNHTGMFVAVQRGYYEEAGLDVRIVQPPEFSSLPLLAGNRVQFAITFQEEIATALSGSAPLPIVAVATIIQHNLSGLISLAEREITRPQDLQGMRYATWETPLETALMEYIISADGGDPDLLINIPNTVTDVFSALATDTDVIWIFYGWDGIAGEVMGIDFNYMEFRDLDPVFDFFTPVIAAAEPWLAANPDLARAFLEATRRGYQFAIDNPEEAAAYLLLVAPELDADIVIASQHFLAQHYMADEERWGYMSPERWNAFYTWLFEQGITESNLAGRGFTNDFLP